MRVSHFYMHKKLYQTIIQDERLHRWLMFSTRSDFSNTVYLMDLHTGLVWLDQHPVDIVKTIEEFYLPQAYELRSLMDANSDFPRKDIFEHLAEHHAPYLRLTNNQTWHTREKRIINAAHKCQAYPVNRKFKQALEDQYGHNGAGFFPVSTPEKLRLVKEHLHTQGYGKVEWSLPENDDIEAYLPVIKRFLLEQEHLLNNRPVLPAHRMTTNPDEGIWNLALQEPLSDQYVKIDLDQMLYGTDFEHCINEDAVIAIDFGTSSTVVARAKGNQVDLLPIGLQDISRQLDSKAFENPTVLEFLDAEGATINWRSLPYRPMMEWRQVISSHEAQQNFRKNVRQVTDKLQIARMMSNIKILVREDIPDSQCQLRDQHGQVFNIDLPDTSEFTLHEPISVSKDYLLDPIEMYAWHIGLNLNNHANGLYLKYHLTFPVQYSRQSKDKILASFRRGLLRSMPEALFFQEAYQHFSVTEVATEPAAFAAAILDEHEVDPDDDNENGTAFAVFDFGGGTTDFAYGYWRWADEDEIDERGYQYVLSHFHPSGDIDLGGENLVWAVAYKVYLDNIEEMRLQKIPFHKPSFEPDKPGFEHLLRSNYQARTNRHLLIEQLRDLWEAPTQFMAKYTDDEEEDESVNTPIESIRIPLQMIDVDNEEKTQNLTVDVMALQALLQERIQKGVRDFFLQMKQAFAEEVPETVEVFLAGNSCKSEMVQSLFQLDRDEDERDYSDFWEDCPDIKCQFIGQTGDLNGKTGVALGILKLREGGQILERGPVDTGLPFAWIVGRTKRGRFYPLLKSDSPYEEWMKIGPIASSGVFRLLYTKNPLALEVDDQDRPVLKTKDPSIQSIDVRFENPSPTDSVYARPLSPNVIEVCVAEQDPDGTEYTQEIELR